MPFVFSVKDTYRQAVEAATGGKNTVMYDDKGNPSIMVAIPRFNISDVIDGGPNTPHPAFIVNGVTKDVIYISKYQNIVHDNRAYSLPMQDPVVNVSFDQAFNYCKNKGPGWHLKTNAEWMAIALWCKKNNFMPRGNNNYGSDVGAAWEKGKETYGGGDPYRTYRVATGSGPASWAHDNTNDGIFDLNGNVSEWVGGLRLMNGEIQILIDNNAADNLKDQGAASAEWKAIAAADGAIVAPGTAGTLKFDYTGAPAAGTANFEISDTIVNPQPDETAYGNKAFETLTAHAGVNVPVILKALGIFPVDASHGGDYIYMRNLGERLPSRGGNWNSTASAGVFSLYLSHPRSNVSAGIGFRSAFVL
jgi:sulfatase modifying factor 1